MGGLAVNLVTFVAIGLLLAHANRPDGHVPMRGNGRPDATCPLGTLPGIASQLARAGRLAGSPASGREVAAARASDAWRVAVAVIGDSGRAKDTLASPSAFTDPRALHEVGLPCTPAIRARDAAAYRMQAAGYSAREVADVLAGHLTLADLDEAQARLMAGLGQIAVAAFLEARWQGPSGTGTRAPARAPAFARWVLPPHLDANLVDLARAYQVAPDLVRAVVAAESGGNPAAVSRAGAIGLMQLMPPTAAALGVDPWQPLENLRGGIAYLAGLLRAYNGNTRLALIAYNAGPQHANRVRDGRAVAYRETREYLDTIATHVPLTP